MRTTSRQLATLIQAGWIVLAAPAFADDPPPQASIAFKVDLFEVGYGPADAEGTSEPRCHIYFDRRQAAFGERVVETFAGGNVMVHGDFQPRALDIDAAQSSHAAVTAAIRMRPDTPWRCVAAAMYGIQRAGYATNVGFISTPEG